MSLRAPIRRAQYEIVGVLAQESRFVGGHRGIGPMVHGKLCLSINDLQNSKNAARPFHVLKLHESCSSPKQQLNQHEFADTVLSVLSGSIANVQT